ncbi:hypothetical protein [Hoyosella altamirensis]|uniref:Uncharacterized protein n=1 Tax=Hoyosella altamirensis TaxID=616997 RepID=A0A839RGM2_9ACTN|nr:hypothetical protein [Hoyosella altamirensis]MBB3035755.1 hypothetical protein [Hoyosella altamirensis]
MDASQETALDDVIASTEKKADDASSPVAKRLGKAALVGLTVARGPVGIGLLAAQRLRSGRKAAATSKKQRSKKVKVMRGTIWVTSALGLAGLAAYMAKHWDELSEGGPESPQIGLSYDTQT